MSQDKGKAASKADTRGSIGAKSGGTKTAGASTHSLQGVDYLRSYFANHRLVAKQTIQNLVRSFVTSTMTWILRYFWLMSQREILIRGYLKRL